MRDDEGILVSGGGLDLGGEAAVEREFCLVLVDDARKVAHGYRRQRGLRTSSHWSPMVSTSSSGSIGEADSIPVVIVSSERAGYFRVIAFAESIAFRVKLPRLAFARSPVLHGPRGMDDRNHGAEARCEQLFEG